MLICHSIHLYVICANFFLFCILMNIQTRDERYHLNRELEIMNVIFWQWDGECFLFVRPLAILFADIDQPCLISDSRFLDRESKRGSREKRERYFCLISNLSVNLLGMYIKESRMEQRNEFFIFFCKKNTVFARTDSNYRRHSYQPKITDREW